MLANPATSLTVGATGTVTLSDPNGGVLAQFDVSANLSPEPNAEPEDPFSRF